jgi:hypothetical protein
MKKFEKIKCEKCGATLAYKVQGEIQIKCRNNRCNHINIIAKEIQFEVLPEQSEVVHLA